MKFDKYNRVARFYPSLIILIPFLLFTINCHLENLESVFDSILGVIIIGNITISIVLLYFFVQINRFLGKFLFERIIFNNELQMPTTRFLLFSDTEFSREYKNQIRERIKNDFQIELPSELEENQNNEDARKRILEAVGLIRQKVKDGRLLLQHNIEYGFTRNLIGGSVIGLLMSVFNIVYFYNINDKIIGGVSIALTICFAFLLIIFKPIINYLGNQYAKRLFQEYIQK